MTGPPIRSWPGESVWIKTASDSRAIVRSIAGPMVAEGSRSESCATIATVSLEGPTGDHSPHQRRRCAERLDGQRELRAGREVVNASYSRCKKPKTEAMGAPIFAMHHRS